MAKRTFLGDLGLLGLRIATGGILAAHGYPKLFGGPDKPVLEQAKRYLGEGFATLHRYGGLAQTANYLRSLNVTWAEGAAPVVALVEFVGGICLILGLYTRLAALMAIADMEEAIRLVHAPVGLMGNDQQRGYEWPLMILAASVALLGEGPGRLSVDSLRYLIRNARRQARKAQRQLAEQKGELQGRLQGTVAR